MKPSEKRTSTQLGLGKVSPEPPPGSGPISAAPAPRSTRSLESSESVAAEPRSSRTPVDVKPSGSRAIEGRPIATGATSATGRRIESAGSSPVARSARLSIREDDVGAAVRGAPARGSAPPTPRLLKTKTEIAAAPIDHRAGFLLAHIDGATTVQGLVDVSGMPEEEVNEILDRLRRLGIVTIR